MGRVEKGDKQALLDLAQGYSKVFLSKALLRLTQDKVTHQLPGLLQWIRGADSGVFRMG